MTPSSLMEPAWAWRVLGLAPGSSPTQVRNAFRVSAQLLHPDRVAELGADVVADAQRRMAELAEAYRVCTAIARGAPPPPPRAARRGEDAPTGTLRPVGGQAAALLAEAKTQLARLAPVDVFHRGGLARLNRDDNAATSRLVVGMLEQIADAWPGTAEGDEARALLVTSVAAANSLSPRERAGHLVLVVDVGARDAAWEGLTGRDELGVAQVVHGHPTAGDALRQRARERLAELDDWVTLARDADPDIRRSAIARQLLREGALLAERAAEVGRRERGRFDAEHADWRARVEALRREPLDESLAYELAATDTAIRRALTPSRKRA